MEFNWEDLKNGKIAVHCKTEEESKEFIKECYKHGISWMHSCANETNWKWYKEDTYYKCDSNSYLSYGNINNGLVVDFPVVEYKEDNKMELKEGMIVECRNGNKYLLRNVRGELLLSANEGWNEYTYDNNFVDIGEDAKAFNGDYDIMKIYESKAYVLEDLFNNNYLTCIWERKEPKKMTLAQISEALGYEVEVIDNE